MEEKPKISRADFISCNILRVEMSDTGYCGGDASHGGRVAIKFTDRASTCMLINGAEANTVKIEFRGDAERDTLIGALQFLVQELKTNGYNGNIRYIAENHAQHDESLIKGVDDDSFSFTEIEAMAHDAPHVLKRALSRIIEKIKIDPRDYI